MQRICSKIVSCSKIIEPSNDNIQKNARNMRKTEVFIIFYLLQEKANLSKNIRQMAADLGLSIGSVHNALQHLQEEGFLIEDNDKRILRKRTQLIDLWAIAYAALKPKYLLCRFTFLSQPVRDQWQNIVLPETLSWGGEPAAALQDHFLFPERWDVYTADNANGLIATGRMIPNPQGEIFVYKRFWKENGTPLLVVYADLLATKDDRCLEMAERLRLLI